MVLTAVQICLYYETFAVPFNCRNWESAGWGILSQYTPPFALTLVPTASSLNFGKSYWGILFCWLNDLIYLPYVFLHFNWICVALLMIGYLLWCISSPYSCKVPDWCCILVLSTLVGGACLWKIASAFPLRANIYAVWFSLLLQWLHSAAGSNCQLCWRIFTSLFYYRFLVFLF